MKTELQNLFARPKAGTGGTKTEVEFVWMTTKTVRTTYAAKRERTPDQRIVRSATSRYPAHVVSYDGRKLHVFENAVTPIEKLRMQAMSRIPNFKVISQ
jgi:hypothetical protein